MLLWYILRNAFITLVGLLIILGIIGLTFLLALWISSKVGWLESPLPTLIMTVIGIIVVFSAWDTIDEWRRQR